MKMKLRNGVVKVLNGLDVDSLVSLLNRDDLIVTARNTHGGWMGSAILDIERSEPIVTTIKKYKTKARAIQELLHGIEIGFK